MHHDRYFLPPFFISIYHIHLSRNKRRKRILQRIFTTLLATVSITPSMFGTIVSAKKRRGEEDPYTVGTRDVTSRVITQTWVLYFHQRYHAATMTPARKSGEGKKRGGECRSNRLHVRRYCYRHAAPLLHVRVGTRRSPASLQARNPALRRLQRGGRPDDVLFFPFPPSPSSPLAQLEEKKTQAQPFSLHASLLSARAAREEPTATLFSFPSTLLQLGIITRAPTCVRIDSGCRGVTN